jgi:DNA (cytosine-5)-methyltransferase 1
MPLPMPSATEYGSSGNGSGNNTRSRGRPSLGTIAKKRLWPTPMANEGRNRHSPDGKRGYGLETAAKMWPTPKSEPGGPDYARAKRPNSGGDDLSTAVARGMVPSPGAHDWISGKGWNVEKQRQAGHTPQLRHLSGGQLNPTWVEWLMGFPTGWTD